MLSARHWEVTTLKKPIGLPILVVYCVAGLAALAGCANNPAPTHVTAAAVVTPSPAPSTSTPIPATRPSSPADTTPPQNDPLVESVDPPAFNDHTFVSPMPNDLFVRL